ncbi:hypothetical protein C8N30_0809 [Sulfitobacter guttiformis]|uniref:Uncharacterized protein n=1 Tax=Sulfitobacter guttiformis TaxID=74349 RepID=A0A420DPV5_9RHOB|nr:hypothetical protein C8N30_0809 [Sulfitobacter guttiformis]
MSKRVKWGLQFGTWLDSVRPSFGAPAQIRGLPNHSLIKLEITYGRS